MGNKTNTENFIDFLERVQNQALINLVLISKA